MNRTVRTLLGLLTIGLVALTSCKKENQEPKQNEGTTYVNVAISIPTATGLRDVDHGKGDDGEYNPTGKWNGKDAIEDITVYVVDKNSVSWDGYTKDDFTIVNASQNPDPNNKAITIKPNKAILTTPGNKKVYVVINAPQAIKDYLNKAIPNEFEKAYATAVSVITAKEATKSVSGNDVILMTNATEPAEQTIEDNVTQEQAKNGVKNQVQVQVQRAVARVILTTTKPEYEIVRADGVKLGKIKNITYAVAQGEKNFYLTQKRFTSDVVTTPGYRFIPKVNKTSGLLEANTYSDMDKYYDYSDLVETAQAGNERKALVAANLNDALAIGEKSLESSAFIFENTHKYGKYDVFDYKGGYRRANTAYVLVRATFVPENDAFADKAKFTESYQEGTTFYVGENGALYRSALNVTDDKGSAGGVKDQKYSEYTNGKVLYYAIVNPDNTERPLNAPAYRNNIYHISVKGFKKIGVNWNPLFPEDPNTPDPKKNPDPKPNNPNEPVPPIKPEDNLSPKETYMSVDVSVIPWNVHTYDIELTIP